MAFTFTKYSLYSVTTELAYSKIKALCTEAFTEETSETFENVSYSCGKRISMNYFFALFVLLLRKREEMSQKCKKENFLKSKFCFSTNGALEFKMCATFLHVELIEFYYKRK